MGSLDELSRQWRDVNGMDIGPTLNCCYFLTSSPPTNPVSNSTIFTARSEFRAFAIEKNPRLRRADRAGFRPSKAFSGPSSRSPSNGAIL